MNIMTVLASAKDTISEGVDKVSKDVPVNPEPVAANIINVAIFALGIAAVIVVVVGGVMYSTSQGDPTKVKKAKDAIMYAIIGLIVSILAYAIVNFVIKGVFI